MNEACFGLGFLFVCLLWCWLGRLEDMAHEALRCIEWTGLDWLFGHDFFHH
jgi:hypothetical protein